MALLNLQQYHQQYPTMIFAESFLHITLDYGRMLISETMMQDPRLHIEIHVDLYPIDH